jgi:hypothetical protein
MLRRSMIGIIAPARRALFLRLIIDTGSRLANPVRVRAAHGPARKSFF